MKTTYAEMNPAMIDPLMYRLYWSQYDGAAMCRTPVRLRHLPECGFHTVDLCSGIVPALNARIEVVWAWYREAIFHSLGFSRLEPPGV